MRVCKNAIKCNQTQCMRWIKCTATVNSKCKLTSSEANVCESLFKRNILFFSLVSDNVTIMKSKHIKRCFSVSLVSKHFFITLFGPNEHQGRLGRRAQTFYGLQATIIKDQHFSPSWNSLYCCILGPNKIDRPDVTLVCEDDSKVLRTCKRPKPPFYMLRLDNSNVTLIKY